ncbi:hypothetical protein ACFX15_030787 [Malus domestica]
MDAQIQEAVPCRPCIKVEFQLGSETYSVKEHKGILSEQLVSVKEESMRILKDFITRHNVPNDVPDEIVENSSEDDGEILEKPPVKSKKTNFVSNERMEGGPDVSAFPFKQLVWVGNSEKEAEQAIQRMQMSVVTIFFLVEMHPSGRRLNPIRYTSLTQ